MSLESVSRCHLFVTEVELSMIYRRFCLWRSKESQIGQFEVEFRPGRSDFVNSGSKLSIRGRFSSSEVRFHRFEVDFRPRRSDLVLGGRIVMLGGPETRFLGGHPRSDEKWSKSDHFFDEKSLVNL